MRVGGPRRSGMEAVVMFGVEAALTHCCGGGLGVVEGE